MLLARSHHGVPVRLTEERWQHITSQHPEMVGQQGRVLETLSQPDMIQAGNRGELLAVRLYAETPLGTKFLVVVYREVDAGDGFVLTAYFSRRPSARRETTWQRR